MSAKPLMAGQPRAGSMMDLNIADARTSDRDCCAKCRFFYSGDFLDTGRLLCRRYPKAVSIGTLDLCGEFMQEAEKR